MPIPKWKVESRKDTFGPPNPLSEVEATQCVFGICPLAIGVTAACSHLWTQYSATVNDAQGDFIHGSGTQSLTTRARDRVKRHTPLTNSGKIVTVTLEHSQLWPIGAETALLLVQRSPVTTNPRFLFLAKTQRPLFMTLDVFSVHGGSQRIVLSNAFKGFEREHTAGCTDINTSWWDGSKSFVHQFEFSDTVLIGIAGITSTVGDALSMPDYCA